MSSLFVVNITTAEISNNIFTNAFAVAVAQSMEIDSSFVLYETTSPLRRRLLEAAFQLIFQVNVPVSSLNISSLAVNATLIELTLLNKFYVAVDTGDTLMYVKAQLSRSNYSALFRILPFGSISPSPTYQPSTSAVSPTTSSSNSLAIQLAAILGGAFVALICTGATFVLYRRRTVSSNLSKKYRPISSPVIDEEMSMGSIYSSPKSDGEDGVFSLNVQHLRLMQNGEEHKSAEIPSASPPTPNPPPSVAITVNEEVAYDTSAVVAIDNSADLSFSSTTAAVVSFLERKGWNRKKPSKVDEEADFSFDSLYPENKPITFSQFGPGNERRTNQDDKSQLNFHDVYPDRTSEEIDSTTKIFNKSKFSSTSGSPLKVETLPQKFGSKLPTPVDKGNVIGFNPMRGNSSKNNSEGNKSSSAYLNLQREQLKKPTVNTNIAYRDQIIESRKQLRRLDPVAGNNPLSYQASRSSAMKANAAKFADPVLSSTISAVKKRNGSFNITDPPRRHKIPIVEVFKSVNVAQMSGLSPGIKFRLSKLKFEARSGDK